MKFFNSVADLVLLLLAATMFLLTFLLWVVAAPFVLAGFGTLWVSSKCASIVTGIGMEGAPESDDRE